MPFPTNFSFISQFVGYYFESLKKILVGDLRMEDITDFLHKPPFRSLEMDEIQRYVRGNKWDDADNTKHVIVKHFGLIGSFLGINVAVIRGNLNDKKGFESFLNKIDNMKDSRKPFAELSKSTSGVPAIASISGQKGLELHKEFVRILPPMEFVIERVVQCTTDALKAKKNSLEKNMRKEIDKLQQDMGLVMMTEAKNKRYNDLSNQIKTYYSDPRRLFDVSIINLTKRILVNVLLGLEINDTISSLIPRMLTQDETIQNDYQEFITTMLDEIQNNGATYPKAALPKLIQYYKNENRSLVAQDLLINNLVGVLLTADNIGTLLRCGLDIFILNEKLRNTLVQDINHQHDLASLMKKQGLKDLFEHSSSMSFFEPRTLPRYVSESIQYDGELIPAGTTLFIQHRSIEDKQVNNSDSSNAMFRTVDRAAFSFGHRACPGQKLSEFIFKAVMSVIIEQYASYKLEDSPESTEECSPSLCK